MRISVLKFFFYLLLFSTIFGSCKEEREDETSIWNAFSFLSMKNQYPFEIDITNQYSKAILQQEHLDKFHSNSRSNDWEWIGPDNISGRMLCIAVNPIDTNEIWAGSASAGLWKSISGGIGKNAWVNINLGFPVLGVSSIAIDPNNTNIIYIGTGESYSYEDTDGGKHNRILRGSWGIGILKSKDGGKTWYKCLNWSKENNKVIWKIIIDPRNSQIIYASGTHGLYKSEDGGEHWALIFNKKMSNELLMHCDYSNILYVGVGGIGCDEFGIYKTSDSGVSWTEITNGSFSKAKGRIMITQNKKYPNKFYALLSDSFKTIKFIKSNNSFKSYSTFSLSDVSSYQGWYAKGIVSNEEGNEVLLGGVDLYLDSTGSFNNFVRYQMGKIGVHSDFHDIIVNPLDPSTVYFATDGGIFRTNDFGRSFLSINNGLITSQFYSGSFSNDGQFGIAGLQDNRSALYTGSPTWEKTHYGDGTASAINSTNTEILFCSSQNLNLSKSVDKAVSWKDILVDESGCFVTPFKMSKSNENVLYAGSSKLYKSLDNGNTFKAIKSMLDSAVINALEVSDFNSDFIIYATIPTRIGTVELYKSYDGGASIIKITGELPNRVISDITIINSLEYYICVAGFESEHVFKTTNGGLSWISIDNGLPDIPCHTIWSSLIHPEIVFTGSELGLYFTKDNGLNWKLFLPPNVDAIPIYDLIYLEKEKRLVVLTHGRGAYKINPFDVVTNTEDNSNIIKAKSTWIFASDMPPSITNESRGILYNLSGNKIATINSNLSEMMNYLESGVYIFNSKQSIYKIIKY
ncbi:MAG: hypothetical protein ABI851_04760 [Saprospiraceae bacterium]